MSVAPKTQLHEFAYSMPYWLMVSVWPSTRSQAQQKVVGDLHEQSPQPADTHALKHIKLETERWYVFLWG
jgi:hypothetical protein